MNPPAGPAQRTSRSEDHGGGAARRKALPPEGRSRKKSGNKHVGFLMVLALTIGGTHSYTSLQKWQVSTQGSKYIAQVLVTLCASMLAFKCLIHFSITFHHFYNQVHYNRIDK